MSRQPDALASMLNAFVQQPWPDQQEVIDHWEDPDAPPLVSVFCATYNHEAWISDAIKGFVLQQTPFAFEIIIHDDASTDNTAGIISALAERYPKLIKPILQRDNQRSLGNRPSKAMLPASRGAFIAMCEGDDHWIDAHKLALQATRLMAQPELSLITHNAISMKGSRLKLFRRIDQEHGFRAKDIIDCDRQFAPTASYMFKRELYDILPEWFGRAPVGDFYMELYSQKLGSGLYLPNCMSVYRQNLPGSWSAGFAADRKKKLKFLRENLPCLAQVQNDFPEESAAIEAKIRRSRWKLLEQLLHLGDQRQLLEALQEHPVPGAALHRWALQNIGQRGLRSSLWLARKLAG